MAAQDAGRVKHFQDSFLPLYEQTLFFRVYETFFVPACSTARYRPLRWSYGPS